MWELGAGIGHIRFPDYRGAESISDYRVGFPYLVYRGDRLKLDREGFRGLLFESEHWKSDFSIDGSVPVDSDNGGLRADMPDLDPALEVGPSLVYEFSRSSARTVALHLPVRAVIATDLRKAHLEGWVFHPHLRANYWGRFNFGVSAGPLFGASSYHRYYYAVDPDYATPERPAYRPDGGYSGFRITLSVSRRFGRLYVGSFLRYDDLSGAEFADSPLVETERAVMAGVSMAWIFAESDRMVTIAVNQR